MRKSITVALFVVIIATASVSGCTILPGGQNSPTPTVIYGPVPSAMPTPTPTPMPASSVTHSKSSDALKIYTSPLDYKIVTDQKTRDGRQFENITLMVVNDGTEPATNIILAVTIVNEKDLQTLHYQEFRIGDLPRGGQYMGSLITDPHGPSNFIKITINMQWGDNGEYYTPTPALDKTFSFML